MKKRLVLPLFFSVFLLLSFSVPVLAPDADQINMTDFPEQLGQALGIGTTAGGILCSIIFIFMWLVPLNIFIRSDRVIPNLIVGLGTMGFCVAVEWLHYFILLIICLIISAIYSGKIRDWVSRD